MPKVCFEMTRNHLFITVICSTSNISLRDAYLKYSKTRSLPGHMLSFLRQALNPYSSTHTIFKSVLSYTIFIIVVHLLNIIRKWKPHPSNLNMG